MAGWAHGTLTRIRLGRLPWAGALLVTRRSDLLHGLSPGATLAPGPGKGTAASSVSWFRRQLQGRQSGWPRLSPRPYRERRVSGRGIQGCFSGEAPDDGRCSDQKVGGAAMTVAITYAFVCLLFTALNDFVFKLFAGGTRASRGGFVAVVGFFWFVALVWLPKNPDSSLAMTLGWGALSGVFSLAGNILLIEAMGMQSAGVCSTIYRLNMVFVVLGAFFLLGENVSWHQAIGIGLALLAIVAFLPDRRDVTVRPLGFYLALLAALLRAGMGLSYSYAFAHGADKNGVVLVNSLFWMAGGMLYAWQREKGRGLKDRGVLGYGLLSGALVAGIVFCMAGSLHLGAASVVLPIAQMSFLGTFALSAIFLAEPCTPRKIGALVCGVMAVVMLALGAQEAKPEPGTEAKPGQEPAAESVLPGRDWPPLALAAVTPKADWGQTKTADGLAAHGWQNPIAAAW